MSQKLIIRPEAEADLAEGFDWYEERRIGLGFEFLARVNSVLGKIEENPLRYSAVYNSVRQALIRQFPYKLLYLYEEGQIEIIGVVHAKRSPAYWKMRVAN